MSRANPPPASGCFVSNASIARGIDAADVLPDVRISSAIITESGSSISFAIVSMMRIFAWCGIKAASSLALTPAFSRIRFAALLIANDAQRKTV